MKTKFKIFVGLDELHPEAYETCKYSILENNDRYDISVHPINCNTIRQYSRIKDKFESTQFAFARFFAPHECGYKGQSVFVDGDFLFLESIDSLLDLYDSHYPVMCCKHNYTPNSSLKMDDKLQSIYPRKNWSSLMIFNNSHPDVAKLTPERVNQESGKYLHRFKWANKIGSIPVGWNWLVGYYKETFNFKPKALHYTDGGPWLSGFANCEYHEEWTRVLRESHE
jgi:lipopolysaccharide biosynthesis glycosyltransferase